MVTLAQRSQLVPVTRETAIRIVASTHAMDYSDAARRMLYFVRRHVTRIDESFEFVQEPWWLLEQIRENRRCWGDCDDQSCLLATLTFAIGIPTRFVAIGQRGVAYEHVYPECRLRGGWKALDPQNNSVPPGDWMRWEFEL